MLCTCQEWSVCETLQTCFQNYLQRNTLCVLQDSMTNCAGSVTCHCSQKAKFLMHCQGGKQEDKTSDCFPYLAVLKPHLGYCVWLGFPSRRVILTNCSESGQESCCSWRPVLCGENVREVLLFSQEKGKGQSAPPQFPILQRNTERPGTDSPQRHAAVDAQQSTVTAHSRGNSSWAQRNSKFRSTTNTATQPQRDGGISTLANPKFTWTIPWAVRSEKQLKSGDLQSSLLVFSSNISKIKREIIVLVD